MFANFLVGGIDWSQVFQAALFGAIGGGLGAWIGYRLVGPRLAGKARQTVPLVILILTISIFSQIPSFSLGLFPGFGNQNLDRTIEEAFRKEPIFGVIFEDYPELVEPSILRLRNAYEAEGNEGLLNESAILGAEISQKYFITYIPSATGEGIDSYIKGLVDFIQIALAKDSAICFDVMFGAQDLGVRLQKDFSKRDLRMMIDATNDLIVSADKTTSFTPIPAAEFEKISLDLVAVVNERLSPEEVNFEGFVLPGLVKTKEEKENVCKTGLELFKAIQELPPEQRHPFFKTIYAGQAVPSK